MTPPLYTATVPILRSYLGRVTHWVDTAPQGALDHRIADSFPAGQHLATAAGFALRITCPLAGRPAPDLPRSLAPRLAVVRATLGAMKPADFAEAEDGQLRHRAGEADLTQSAPDFVHLYGMPNFFFHLTMGYASLRAFGMVLGKEDFDGLHRYPPGFRFP